MPNPLLTAALDYALDGWRVVPLHSPTENGCSCNDPSCDHIGKHPRIHGWRSQATTNERQICAWWKQWPDANVGIATGKESDLLVLDYDTGELPVSIQAPTASTGKGQHYYFAHADTTNRVKPDGWGFDIRTDGGLIVAPPSRHANGNIYKWLAPPSFPLPAAPLWLLNILQPSPEPEPSPNTAPSNPTQGGAGAYALRALHAELELIQRAPEGQRNAQLNRSAFALGTIVGAGELDELLTFDQLVEAAIQAGLSPSEAHQTTRSGLQAGMQKPRTIEPARAPDRPAERSAPAPVAGEWTTRDYIEELPEPLPYRSIIGYLNEEEYGDAKLLAELYAGRLLYDHAARQWYYWSGQHWREDKCGLIRHLIAGQVARQYLHHATELTPRAQDEESTKKLVDKLIQRAYALRRLSRCNNVREFATSHLGITGNEWDKNPWVVGVANGVVDLRTGKLRPGRPDDYIQRASPTVWRGLDWPAPRWEQFIAEVFDGNEEIAAFMQRMLGYGITGLTTEHIFPVLYGEKGRNGKDTMLEAIKHTLGELADPVSTDVLIASKNDRGAAQPHLVDLRGRRLVWASETAANARFNEQQIKWITGGGIIKTRQLYSSMIEFAPTHLVLLLTNFKPRANAEDEAFWTRLVLLPFTLRFVANPQAPDERPRDTQLLDKLREQTSGILAWLVRGCLQWQRSGLQVPEAIRASTAGYRSEEDTIGHFLEQCCHISPAATAPASELYKSYRDWCEESGLQALNQMNFGKRIARRFERVRGRAAFVYVGIGLLSSSHPAPESVIPVIPVIPFSKSKDHESESAEKNRKTDQGDHTDHVTQGQLSPPPGQGEEGQQGRAAPVARESVDTRRWWLKKARELLREHGTPAELATPLDEFTVLKLQEFCTWLQERTASPSK